MEYEIRPVDMENASDEDWAAFHRFSCETIGELFPEQPLPSAEVIKADMINNMLFNNVSAFNVVTKDEPTEWVAWLRCTHYKEDSPSYPGNEEFCRIHLTVHERHRKKGIARKLIAEAYEHALDRNKTQFTGNLLNHASRELLRKIGGKEALAFRVSHLKMDDVDWDLMEQWVKEGSQRSPTSSIEFHIGIPDSILEDYCNVYTEVLNQAPRDELTVGDHIFTPEEWRIREDKVREKGQTWISALVKEQNGDISGLTDVGYEPSTPTILHQYLTGVQEKYRGRGLGKWLKGAMLLKIRDEFPEVEVVSTSTATSNEPMLAINERMGFQLIRESYAYQVDVQKVKEYLS